MRLIDADKLPIWSFPISWEEGVGIEKCCKAVEEAPTVEAIPIEWIEHFAEKIWWEDERAVIEDMLERWEKENE